MRTLQQLFAAIVITFALGIIVASGQNTAVKPSVIVGEVTSVADLKFMVNSATGPMEVVTNDKSAFKKVSAENPNLATATPAAFGDIGIGDKLTVSGFVSADGKSITSRTVYFMTKADIAAKHAKESAEWNRRGVQGKITAVNPQTNQVTIESRSMTGSTTTVITPKEGAKILRYAPDSVRFDEALKSSLEEAKVGDMLRALGDRSSDGTSFAAEQLVTGAFETVAGTVVSVDAAKNEVVIKNLSNNKNVTVAIGETSVLKRFPAEQAEMLARFQMMGAGGARPMGPGAGGRPQGGNPQTATPGGATGQPGQGQPGQGRPGMGAGPRAGGVEDILERSPTITVADLKAGDIIALSSSKSADATRLKAIKLFAGVEPFLRAAQAGGRRGAGGGPDFNIPGLDGIGFP